MIQKGWRRAFFPMTMGEKDVSIIPQCHVCGSGFSPGVKSSASPGNLLSTEQEHRLQQGKPPQLLPPQ